VTNSRILAITYDTGLSALLDEFDPLPDWKPASPEWAPRDRNDSVFVTGWQADLSVQSETTVRFRVECSRSLLDLAETDPELRWQERRISAVLDQIYMAAVVKVRAARQAPGTDRAFLTFKKPTVENLLGWLTVFEASGEDPMSLRPAEVRLSLAKAKKVRPRALRTASRRSTEPTTLNLTD
jgi:hypothetical protein